MAGPAEGPQEGQGQEGSGMRREWLEAYKRDSCPRCGAPLGAPDEDFDRHCQQCGITVCASRVIAVWTEDT
jgi:hypothetical protein